MDNKMKEVIEDYLKNGEHNYDFPDPKVRHYAIAADDRSIYNVIFGYNKDGLPVSRGIEIKALNLLLHINNIKHAR